jgi:hypothetical protein
MKLLCRIFGHRMFFDGAGLAGVGGPSTCKRCGHKDPGIDWPRSYPQMPAVKTPTPSAVEGELLIKSAWREYGGRYGVGDHVTRDGTDVHLCVELNTDGGDMGLFRCIVEPTPYDPCEDPWIRVGEEEYNLTRRYSPLKNAKLTSPPLGELSNSEDL